LTHKNDTPIGINWKLMAFYGKDKVNVSIACCWVRESRDNARNLDLNDQLWYGRPVTLTQDLNRQKVNILFPEK